MTSFEKLFESVLEEQRLASRNEAAKNFIADFPIDTSFKYHSSYSVAKLLEQWRVKKNYTREEMQDELGLTNKIKPKKIEAILKGDSVPGGSLARDIGEIIHSDLGIRKLTFIRKCAHEKDDLNKPSIDIPGSQEPISKERPYELVTAHDKHTIKSEFYKSFMKIYRDFMETKAKEKNISKSKIKNADDYTLLSHLCEFLGNTTEAKSGSFIHPLMISNHVPLPPDITSTDMANEIADLFVRNDKKERRRIYDLAVKHFDSARGIDLITPLEKGIAGFSDAFVILRFNKGLSQEEVRKIAREKYSDVDVSSLENGTIPIHRKDVQVLLNIYKPCDERQEQQRIYRTLEKTVKKDMLKEKGYDFREEEYIDLSQALANIFVLSGNSLDGIAKLADLSVVTLHNWTHRINFPDSQEKLKEVIEICRPHDEFDDVTASLYEDQKNIVLKRYQETIDANMLGKYNPAKLEDIDLSGCLKNLLLISQKTLDEIEKEVGLVKDKIVGWLYQGSSPTIDDLITYIKACEPPEAMVESRKLYDIQKVMAAKRFNLDRRENLGYCKKEKIDLSEALRNIYILSGLTQERIAGISGIPSSTLKQWIYPTEEDEDNKIPNSEERLKAFVRVCEPEDKLDDETLTLYEQQKAIALEQYEEIIVNDILGKYKSGDIDDITMQDCLRNIFLVADIPLENIAEKSKLKKGKIHSWLYSGNNPLSMADLASYIQACKLPENEESDPPGYKAKRREMYDIQKTWAVRKFNRERRKKLGYCDRDNKQLFEALKNIYILSGSTRTEISIKSGLKKTDFHNYFYLTKPTTPHDKMKLYLDACQPDATFDDEEMKLYKENKMVVCNIYGTSFGSESEVSPVPTQLRL